MASPTYNIYLNRPDNGDYVGTWDQPVNSNWDTIDALFAATGATSGGSGHVHNGTRGQGPKIDHDDLEDIGNLDHSDIDSNITNLWTQLNYVTNNYCADPTCGGKGIDAEPNPPLHYTDNFTVNLPTPLAQMDWMVSSRSTQTDFTATGFSAFLRVAPNYLGNPVSEEYAAMVKCQIPHSTAQRLTYHIRRFTADTLQDGDTVMMVMALMSTHLLGTATPFIMDCGIKLVFILAKTGGAYSVTRIALAERQDNDLTVLQQDTASGLTFNAAELFFRGCHEFSTSEDGGVWYYHNRAPVWILPSGSASPYYAPIQNRLLTLGEPAFGAIGFGWAWDVRAASSFDVDMTWLTIDSKDNVEDEYTTNYPDPGNTPAPIDPEPTDLCCGGAGPGIGSSYTLENGMEAGTVFACITDPFTGFITTTGVKVPCATETMTHPPGSVYVPKDIEEGLGDRIEIPIASLHPEGNLTITIGNESVFEYISYELTPTSVILNVELAGGVFGSPNPTMTLTQISNPLNTLTFTICNITSGSPVLGTPGFFRNYRNYSPGLLNPALFHDGKQTVSVSISNGNSPTGTTPAELTTEFAITGPQVTGTGQSWLMDANTIMAEFTLNTDVAGTVTFQWTDPVTSLIDSTTTDITEAAPIVISARSLTPSGMPFPPFIIEPGSPPGGYSYIDIEVKGAHFQNGCNVVLLAGAALNGATVFVDSQTLTQPIIVTGPAGSVIELRVDNPSASLHSNVITAFTIADYSGPDPITLSTFINPASDPVEGQYVRINAKYPKWPNTARPNISANIVGTPLEIVPESVVVTNIDPITDSTDFTVLVPSGLTGSPISVKFIKYYDDPGFTVLGATPSNVVTEPIPSGAVIGTPDLSPGASGTAIITSGGVQVFYPGVVGIGTPTGKITVTAVRPTSSFQNLEVDYEVSDTATPGVDVLSVDVQNYIGASSTTFVLGTVGYPPIQLTSIAYPEGDPVEGRSGVKAVITGLGMDPGTTLSVDSGSLSIDSYTVDSLTQITAYLSLQTLSGGTSFVLRGDAPGGSTDTIGGNILNEAPPVPGLVVKPPTAGPARLLEMPGRNLYVAEGIVPVDMSVQILKPGGVDATGGTLTATSKTNGLWMFMADITANANEFLSIKVVTPAGRTYTYSDVFKVLAADVIPVIAAFDPTNSESIVTTTFTVNGSNFDSVAVAELECETPDNLPIGVAPKVSATLTGMTSSIMKGTYKIPSGCIGNSYLLRLYNSTLAILKEETGVTVAAKTADQPEILNKIATVLPAINKSAGATNTVSVTLAASPAITNPTWWTGVGMVAGTFNATYSSPSFNLTWKNPAAGNKVSIIVENRNILVPSSPYDGFAFVTV